MSEIFFNMVYLFSQICPVFVWPVIALTFLAFLFLRVSFGFHAFLIVGSLLYVKMSLYPLLFSLVVLLMFLVPFVRRNVISKNVMRALKAANALPKISETERIALDAGTVWIEREFFTGSPKFDKIMQNVYPTLSEEEVRFLHNEVEAVCEMTNDWETFENKDLPPQVWEYLRRNKFFAMIIPKEYGGLDFSPLAQSTVVAKLATRSQALAITTMVPNSLGPAELILKYGTEQQKQYFLPRLASGDEVPCFGLTEPTVGSDAASIKSTGVVFKDSAGMVKIRLNFEKRYITLGGVATIIGLAFKLQDPEGILENKAYAGITCALVNPNLSGVKRGRRHNPLTVPFVNSPLWGVDVEISIDDVIGGLDGCGKGWKMLMECLAVGRGISLPAVSAGGAHLTLRAVSAYSGVRKQFNSQIYRFEGVEEVIARMTGNAYVIDAMRKFVAGAVGAGQKPSVTNGIAKYHATEMYRSMINDAMDILGGAGICLGPNNVIGHGYMGAPIAITVEGANIMTRNLIQFGQGVIRCHAYIYEELDALIANDVKRFDKAFWGHVGQFASNRIRMIALWLTRGWLSRYAFSCGIEGKIKRKLNWASVSFAFMSDLALATYAGELKRKETISARFADILSWMIMITCALKRYEAEGRKDADLLEYCARVGFEKIDEALDGIYSNFGGNILVRAACRLSAFMGRVNRFWSKPSDALAHGIVKRLFEDDRLRDSLTEGVFIPSKSGERLADLEVAFELARQAADISKKIRVFEKQEKVHVSETEALNLGVITKEEYSVLSDAVAYMNKVVQVDHFELKTMFGHPL